MISVIFDTSNRNLSVGVAKDGVLIASKEAEGWQRQSELLIPTLNDLFLDHGLDTKDIKEVIASKGPGSYTGIRISVSVAKVLAFALNVPLYMLSSLEAMRDLNNDSICLMNARGNRSYIGVYGKNSVIISDTIWPNEKVLSYIKEHPSFSLRGDTEYLGIKSEKIDLSSNMLKMKNTSHLVEDPMKAKPVYLKDLGYEGL